MEVENYSLLINIVITKTINKNPNTVMDYYGNSIYITAVNLFFKVHLLKLNQSLS